MVHIARFHDDGSLCPDRSAGWKQTADPLDPASYCQESNLPDCGGPPYSGGHRWLVIGYARPRGITWRRAPGWEPGVDPLDLA